MSCPNFARMPLRSPQSRGEDSPLEEYAEAVRAYQEILLELQDTNSEDPEVVDTLLKRAATAKETVNYYRGGYRRMA
jgi:CHASE3 domain sensor protein